jgi:hypothetical protein
MSGEQPGPGDWADPSGYGAPPGWGTPPGMPPPPPGWGPPPYGGPGPYGMPMAPKPGVVPLRPLAVGEILDGAFTTIRRYPRATLGLAFAVMLAVTAVRLVAGYLLLHDIHNEITVSATGSVSTVSDNGTLVGHTLTLELIVGVVSLVATTLLSGMIAAVVGQAVLGRPMSASEAWQAARGAFWRLLGATLLIGLIGLGIGIAGGVIVVIGVVIAVAGLPALGVPLVVVAVIATVIAMVYILTTLSLTTPTLMLERAAVLTALSRSRTLVRTSWWRVFGIWLLATLIAQVVASIIAFPFSIAAGVSGFLSTSNSTFSFTALLLTGLGSLIGATLTRPFSAAVVSLLYIDRRIRSEALDLTLVQASAGAR